VFSTLDQRRGRKDREVARLNRGPEFVGTEAATLPDLADLHAGIGRRAPELVSSDMRFTGGNGFVTWPRQRAQRDLVGHGTAREPHSGFLAQQLCAARLRLAGAMLGAIGGPEFGIGAPHVAGGGCDMAAMIKQYVCLPRAPAKSSVPSGRSRLLHGFS
jgi:hypothetical protein